MDRAPADAQLAGHIRWTRSFLSDAMGAGALDAAAFARLDAELARRSPVAAQLAVGAPLRLPAPPAGAAGWLPPPPGSLSGHGVTAPPAPLPPSRLSVLRARIAADVAVHGTAYLGVLLVLAAVLGFAMFSASQLPRRAQPVALTTIPAAGFGAAALLRRRGAPFVAAGVELAAGVALPIVGLSGIAIVLSGDVGRVIGWVAVCALGSAAYGAAVHRDPGTVLRHLVVPTAALGAAAAALAATGTSGPVQPAVAAVVGAAALVAATPRQGRRAASPTRSGAVGTVLIAVPLALLGALLGVDVTAVVAVSLCGTAVAIAVVVARDLLAGHPVLVPAVHLTALVVVAGYAVAVLDTAWVGAALTGALLVLTATAHRWGERTANWDLAVAGVLVPALLAAGTQPIAGIGAALMAGGVAHVALALGERTGWRSPHVVGALIAPLVLVGAVSQAPATAAGRTTAGLAVAIAVIVAVALAARTPRGAFAAAICPWAALLLATGNALSWGGGLIFAVSFFDLTLPWHAVAAAAAVAALASARIWRPAARVTAGLLPLAALHVMTADLLGVRGVWMATATAVSATAVAVLAVTVLVLRTDSEEAPARDAARIGFWAGTAVLAGALLVSAPATDGRWTAPIVATVLLATAVWLLANLLAGLRPTALPRAWWIAAGIALPILVIAQPGLVAVPPGALVWVGLSLLACAIGAWRRDALRGVVGTVLLVAGTAQVPWALALALTATALAWTVVAVRGHVATATAPTSATAPAIGGAVAGALAIPVAAHALVAGDLLGAGPARVGVLLLLGALAAAAAVLARDSRPEEGPVAAVADVWVLVGAVGAVLAVQALYAAPLLPAAFPAVLGLLLAAGAVAATANGSGRGWRRVAAAGGGVASLVIAQDLAGLPPGAVTAQLAAAGAILTLLGIVAARSAATRRSVELGSWAPPVLGAAGATGLLAGYAAPSSLALSGVLAVAAVALLGVAAGLGRRAAAAAAVALLAAAWALANPVLLAELGGRGVWVALPFALALLTECELGRGAARRGTAIESSLLALGEWGALAVALLPVLSAQIHEAAGYSLVGVGLAAALLAWALVTRVRRRLALAAIAAVLPLVVLLGVPFLAVLPMLGGVWLWAALGGAGVLLVTAATGMERGRRGVRTVLGRLDEALVGWE